LERKGLAKEHFASRRLRNKFYIKYYYSYHSNVMRRAEKKGIKEGTAENGKTEDAGLKPAATKEDTEEADRRNPDDRKNVSGREGRGRGCG
jgi:hypothetical protein